MTATQTSVESYSKLDISALQSRILAVIKARGDVTNQEIGYELGVFPSTVSGINTAKFRSHYGIEGVKVPRGYGGREVLAWRLREKTSVQYPII